MREKSAAIWELPSRDRPAAEWLRTPNGELAMFTRQLDLAALLKN